MGRCRAGRAVGLAGTKQVAPPAVDLPPTWRSLPCHSCVTSSIVKHSIDSSTAISEFVLESADYPGGVAPMRSRTLLTSGLLLAAIAGELFAHGGGLNAEGCHFNRKVGDYHCHRAPAVAPAVAATQQAPLLSAEQRLATQPTLPRQAVPTRAPSTCFVGPRGGTYTITASGRKNYGGC